MQDQPCREVVQQAVVGQEDEHDQGHGVDQAPAGPEEHQGWLVSEMFFKSQFESEQIVYLTKHSCH